MESQPTAVLTAELKVIGEQRLHCAGCENAVQRGLLRLPGVQEVTADHRTQRIVVTVDTAQISLAAIQERLGWMGWQTALQSAGSASTD